MELSYSTPANISFFCVLVLNYIQVNIHGSALLQMLQTFNLENMKVILSEQIKTLFTNNISVFLIIQTF